MSFFYIKKTTLSRIFIGVTIVIFYVLSIAPGAYILNRSLEAPVDGAQIIPRPYENDLIVILASSASPKKRSFQELSGASWNRLWRGIELYDEFDGKIPILYTGDSGKILGLDIQEPALAKKYAEKAGIPGDHFLTESDSSTTHESVLNVKRIMEGRSLNGLNSKIYLVTSARHMVRSAQDFRRAGMTVISIPTDFITDDTFHFNVFSLFPDSEQFNSSMGALHEFIGSIGYRLYTKAP